ncbi:DUF4102 domain-containing protein, partial [bacterium]|nr:DUF4102 domain-containing protein [bacterium]
MSPRVSHRKLTDAFAARTRAPGWYSDSALSGFALRVTASGARTWIVRYTIPGDARRRIYRIGDANAIGAMEARATASQAIA